MITIILAAGKGTRLYPYTQDLPKCMVPLAGKPLLHWQLQTLRSCGVGENIIVVGGYRAEALSAPGAGVIVNPLYDTTNMVETLFCARDYMVDDDVLICYGDIVYEPGVIRALTASSAPVSIAADRQWRKLWSLRMENPLADAETFKLNAAGAVLELGKKPTGYDEIEAQYMGLIYVRSDYVAAFVEHYDRMDRARTYDGRDFTSMFMTSFLQDLIEHGWCVQACLVNNGWLEIDTADELKLYQRMLQSGDLHRYCNLFNREE